MASIRSISLAAALLVALAGCAQTAVGHAAHHPAGAGEPATMAGMDAHMQAMQAMHEKMDKRMDMMQSMMQRMMDRMQAPAPASP